jgi:hypothetical protein
MSKERARRRTEREAMLAERKTVAAAARARAEAKAGRRARLGRLFGSRGRRAVDARTRERRAVVGSVLLVLVVLTYLMSGSILLVLGVLLVAAVATPAVVLTLSDRSRR